MNTYDNLETLTLKATSRYGNKSLTVNYPKTKQNEKDIKELTNKNKLSDNSALNVYTDNVDDLLNIPVGKIIESIGYEFKVQLKMTQKPVEPQMQQAQQSSVVQPVVQQPPEQLRPIPIPIPANIVIGDENYMNKKFTLSKQNKIMCNVDEENEYTYDPYDPNDPRQLKLSCNPPTIPASTPIRSINTANTTNTTLLKTRIKNKNFSLFNVSNPIPTNECYFGQREIEDDSTTCSILGIDDVTSCGNYITNCLLSDDPKALDVCIKQYKGKAINSVENIHPLVAIRILQRYGFEMDKKDEKNVESVDSWMDKVKQTGIADNDVSQNLKNTLQALVDHVNTSNLLACVFTSSTIPEAPSLDPDKPPPSTDKKSNLLSDIKKGGEISQKNREDNLNFKLNDFDICPKGTRIGNECKWGDSSPIDKKQTCEHLGLDDQQCSDYLTKCLLKGDLKNLDVCIKYNPNNQDAIRNIHPLVAVRILQRYGFETKESKDGVISVVDWLKTVPGKFGENTVNKINGNKNLLDMLNIIVNKVNTDYAKACNIVGNNNPVTSMNGISSVLYGALKQRREHVDPDAR